MFLQLSQGNISHPFVAAAPTAVIHQTGQSTYWDQTGKAISCIATGQDADLLAGMPWPAPRFNVMTTHN